MDGYNIEHSDSDSGESWSLVENIPAYADEVPEFPETVPVKDRGVTETNIDKDEDTDGISIISDSDPETSMPFDSTDNKGLDNPPANAEYMPVDSPLPVNPPSNDCEQLHDVISSEDDFLGDKNMKHKTYVHRRNKRLSTVLNIIVLGSVITAAGVAIGHMWGAKNDCTMNTTPSVNKILSNLYKLQEENAYLRSKLKELTLMTNIQQRKSGTEKQNKCKKVFEESLSKKADKPTKCVDNGDAPKLLDMHLTDIEHEREFLRDIDKLKQVYEANKSWLDDEVSKRLKNEEQSVKRMKNELINKENKDSTQFKGDSFEIVLETISEQPNLDISTEVPIESNVGESGEKLITDRKISYADSLKSEQKMKSIQKRESKVLTDNNPKESIIINKKNQKDSDAMSGLLSEEEFKKDDRYVGPKNKKERKKHDRQKIHKKQKRKNKYEQWEMKGGYLKDYDDFSLTSSQENEYVLKNADKNFLAKEFERNNYIEQFDEADVKSPMDENKINTRNIKDKHGKKNGKNKEKDMTWFEKRAVFRNEARKKLEHELFGETSPNNAGWYFRRMQRREQCRAKGDNSTYKKLLKRNMNFKMKH